MITAATQLADHALLGDVVLLLFAALLAGALAVVFRQSLPVAYLVAGVVVGPGALAIISDVSVISAIGELGLALLLFTVGLELPWTKLTTVGGRVLYAGVAQVVATTVAVALIAAALGSSTSTALVFGMAASLSSTAIALRLLADRSETDSAHGLVAIGVLVVQDLAVVGMLVVIPQLSGSGDLVSGVTDVIGSLGKLLLLAIAIWVIERGLLRRIFRTTADESRRELLVITSLLIPLAAIAACYALELSPTLGALVAGLLMADAPYGIRIRGEIASLRIVLVVVFFAWVGMLADLGWMANHAALIAASVLIVLAAKFVITLGALRLFKVPSYAAVPATAAIAQCGEFSFAIVALAGAGNIIDRDAVQLAVSTAVITILPTGLFLSAARRWTLRRTPEATTVRRTTPEIAAPDAIVVGSGPAGREVVGALRRIDATVSLIEQNPATDAATQFGNDKGVTLVQGDASRPEVLAHAGAGGALIAICTIPDPTMAATVVASLVDVNPTIQVVARGRYDIHVPAIAAAGAHEVVNEEEMVGASLARAAVQRLLR